MWTAGYKYSWRKMEAAAQDRTGWRQVHGLWTPMFHGPPGVTRHKSSRPPKSWTNMCTQFNFKSVCVI